MKKMEAEKFLKIFDTRIKTAVRQAQAPERSRRVEKKQPH
jgi:hypothetical protein